MKNIIRLICLCSILFMGIFSSFAEANNIVSDTMVDATGHRFSTKLKPTRIISLNTSIDEILLDLVSSDRILAVCTSSIDPTMSSVVEKASKIDVRLPLRSSCEVILGLQPDLVLFPESGPREMVDSLRDMGINVYVVRSATNIEIIKEKIKEVSIVVGEVEKGQELLEKLNNNLQKVQQFIESNGDAKKVVLGFTFGGAYGNVKGLFHDICTHAGVINGAAQVNLKMGERLSPEQVMNVNPDIVFLPTWSHYKSNDPQKFLQDFINNEPYKNLKAVKNKEVYLLDEKYRGCGSHYVIDGIMAIHRLAYKK